MVNGCVTDGWQILWAAFSLTLKIMVKEWLLYLFSHDGINGFTPFLLKTRKLKLKKIHLLKYSVLIENLRYTKANRSVENCHWKNSLSRTQQCYSIKWTEARNMVQYIKIFRYSVTGSVRQWRLRDGKQIGKHYSWPHFMPREGL